MVELLWTVVLMGFGITGLWLAPRTWWGWVLGAASEVLWLIYAWTIDSFALGSMAVMWFVVHARNAIVVRQTEKESK